MLRRDDGHALRKALEFEVKGKRKRKDDQRRKYKRRRRAKSSVCLEKEDALN